MIIFLLIINSFFLSQKLFSWVNSAISPIFSRIRESVSSKMNFSNQVLFSHTAHDFFQNNLLERNSFVFQSKMSHSFSSSSYIVTAEDLETEAFLSSCFSLSLRRRVSSYCLTKRNTLPSFEKDNNENEDSSSHRCESDDGSSSGCRQRRKSQRSCFSPFPHHVKFHPPFHLEQLFLHPSSSAEDEEVSKKENVEENKERRNDDDEKWKNLSLADFSFIKQESNNNRLSCWLELSFDAAALDEKKHLMMRNRDEKKIAVPFSKEGSDDMVSGEEKGASKEGSVDMVSGEEKGAFKEGSDDMVSGEENTSLTRPPLNHSITTTTIRINLAEAIELLGKAHCRIQKFKQNNDEHQKQNSDQKIDKIPPSTIIQQTIASYIQRKETLFAFHSSSNIGYFSSFVSSFSAAFDSFSLDDETFSHPTPLKTEGRWSSLFGPILGIRVLIFFPHQKKTPSPFLLLSEKEEASSSDHYCFSRVFVEEIAPAKNTYDKLRDWMNNNHDGSLLSRQNDATTTAGKEDDEEDWVTIPPSMGDDDSSSFEEDHEDENSSSLSISEKLLSPGKTARDFVNISEIVLRTLTAPQFEDKGNDEEEAKDEEEDEKQERNQEEERKQERNQEERKQEEDEKQERNQEEEEKKQERNQEEERKQEEDEKQERNQEEEERKQKEERKQERNQEERKQEEDEKQERNQEENEKQERNQEENEKQEKNQKEEEKGKGKEIEKPKEEEKQIPKNHPRISQFIQTELEKIAKNNVLSSLSVQNENSTSRIFSQDSLSSTKGLYSSVSSSSVMTSCLVCCDQESTVAVVPCGHLPFCLSCSKRFLKFNAAGKTFCPLCRNRVLCCMKIQR